MTNPATTSTLLRVGISSCLLGAPVRYDGGHKLDRYLRDTLGRMVEYVPVCPEVECGLPAPREAMHLVGDPAAPRLVTRNTGRDLTGQMLTWAQRRVRELEQEQLHGFVFKSNSPGCAVAGVAVHTENGSSPPPGAGLFARAFREHFPLLPAESDDRLHDPLLRESFVERVLSLRR